MAEVHEITRKALNDLCSYGALVTNTDFDGAEWITVKGVTYFGRTAYYPVTVYGVRDTESEAVRSADFFNGVSLENTIELGFDLVEEWEVWHVVDDEPDTCDDEFTSRYELRVYYRDDSMPSKPNQVQTYDTLVDAIRAAELLCLVAWETVARCEVWDTFEDGPESFCYSNTCI